MYEQTLENEGDYLSEHQYENANFDLHEKSNDVDLHVSSVDWKIKSTALKLVLQMNDSKTFVFFRQKNQFCFFAVKTNQQTARCT